MPTLPGSYVSPEEYTSDLLSSIDTDLVRQITGGIHVNDALIYGAWEALPPEWTNWWSSIPDHRLIQRDLIDSIDEDVENHSGETGSESQCLRTRPPSLTKWLKTLSTLSLPRAQRLGTKTALPDLLTVPMKIKKIAEVSSAAGYIHDACRAQNINHVIDIGSGQGYLSNTLAYLFPSLHVLAIDGSESQIAGSKAFAASLDIPGTRLKHLVRYVEGSAPLTAEMKNWADGHRCMLVGLHACGSLSEHMLRYFATLPFITSLAAVGCCYNHIRPLSSDCPNGFPISARMRANGVSLSATALMTGCQAPNNWDRADLCETESTYSRRHFYRAVLEKLFFDKGINRDQSTRAAWGIRKSDLASFVSFAKRAIHCLAFEQYKISEAEMTTYEERYRQYSGKIAILWTLSVLCCKIVESVIAMDRYWFLVEHGAEKVDVVPVFDYRVSPRNLMMVAEKPEQAGATAD